MLNLFPERYSYFPSTRKFIGSFVNLDRIFFPDEGLFIVNPPTVQSVIPKPCTLPPSDNVGSIETQFLGTKGFYSDYDARPDDQLTNCVAELWASNYSSLLKDDHDLNSLGESIYNLEQESELPTKRSEFIEILEAEVLPRG